ncbi:MAG: M20/M25/M40 family metallo-hydrolase [Bryobacteraceae bacterium]|nr:M20/M25/M40 family metallo-hydrolase [Bryobacteraceae bacterium]
MLRLRALFCVSFAFCLSAQESADLAVIYRIKNEALKKGKVMEHMAALTDQHGPRLTASPQYAAAAEWAASRLRDWGLTNVHMEKWGPFGRSWSLKRFSAHMTAPQYSPLIGFPLAWSGTTNGVVSGEPILLPARDNDLARFQADLDRMKKQYAGKLKDKIVLTTAPRASMLSLKPLANRYTEVELVAQAAAQDPTVAQTFDYSRLSVPEEREARGAFMRDAPDGFMDAYNDKRKVLRREYQEFLRQEGVLGLFNADPRGDGGTVFSEAAGWYEAKWPSPLPTVAITAEQYNRITRLIEKKVPVKLEFEIAAEISDKDVEPNNVVAEIPGGSKKDELIIVGAHLDSWIGGTGATDNGAGSSVALEAVRILKALNLKLDRTVRIVLWSGEEQGLLGSKAYVKEHYGDPKTMKVTANQARVSAYFNLDNGSGKIRGVYLQENDSARPYFEKWLAPFRDLGVSTISIRSTGGTDHLSFDAVGIPGFQFIQDPLEYSTRTHHSNIDTLDHVQGPDLMQASAVMASVIYHAANLKEMMPRKPLSEPKPKWTPSREAMNSGGN